MIALPRWVLVAVVLFLGGVTAAVVAQNAHVSLAFSAAAPQAVVPSPGCQNEQGLTYVAAIGSQELVRFDRRATPVAKRTVSLPIRPDNVHWATNGKLLTAGPNYVPPAVCSGAGCATGWSVFEVDPETLAFSRLGGADQTAAMQRVSSAIRVGDDIWVGSNDDRIARFSQHRP